MYASICITQVDSSVLLKVCHDALPVWRQHTWLPALQWYKLGAVSTRATAAAFSQPPALFLLLDSIQAR